MKFSNTSESIFLFFRARAGQSVARGACPCSTHETASSLASHYHCPNHSNNKFCCTNGMAIMLLWELEIGRKRNVHHVERWVEWEMCVGWEGGGGLEDRTKDGSCGCDGHCMEQLH